MPRSVSMDALVGVVHGAGRAILEWYGRPGEVVEKEDRTPLTEADQAAHRYLVGELSALAPGVPVLSEESPEEEIRDRRQWRRFWLVDPLDGTKEFLKGTGEFTVNVALVEDGRPIVGVVYVPAHGRTYRASPDGGAEVADGEGGGNGAGGFRPIRTRAFQAEAPILVASRDHAGPGVKALERALQERAQAAGGGENAVRFASMGSSLKFCLVAEGRADLYLRDLPTMEWDTGAAQCVLEAAGGNVYAAEGPRGGHPLVYNKETLRNPGLLAVGDPEGPWSELLGEISGG